jgi:adenylate cyclase
MAVAHARLSIVHTVEPVERPGAGHVSTALELARKAVQLDENEPKAHETLAIALARSRKLDEAERAIELDPNYASGYVVGNVRHFKGEHESAVEFYRKAHKLDPQFDLALQFLGRALFALGRFDMR